MTRLTHHTSTVDEARSKEEEDRHPEEAKERTAPPGLCGREAPTRMGTGVQG
ncbi:MAG: hypothetical protein ACPGU1_14605 [Myxococcota bacterium]